MCKLVTITVDRKTWKEIGRRVEDSDKKIDYVAFIDDVIDSYIRNVGKEDIKTGSH